MNPPEKVHELIEMMGFVDNPADDTYEFTGNNYVVLSRGATFIDETIKKAQMSVPFSEEDKERRQRVLQQKAMHLAKQKEEAEHR